MLYRENSQLSKQAHALEQSSCALLEIGDLNKQAVIKRRYIEKLTALLERKADKKRVIMKKMKNFLIDCKPYGFVNRDQR